MKNYFFRSEEINGKIKKVDLDDLRKIAETLDMSLQKLLKAAGYDEMSLYFHAHKNKDKYIDNMIIPLLPFSSK